MNILNNEHKKLMKGEHNISWQIKINENIYNPSCVLSHEEINSMRSIFPQKKIIAQIN